MTGEELQTQLVRTEAIVRSLQRELAETNRGLVALTLELEQRVDERNVQLRVAHAILEKNNAKLASTEATVHTLQAELAETNRGLVALTLELEQRVDARTAELRQLNLELEARVQSRTLQLREANDNLQNFAHTAAHDLRSPLRAIKSFSSIVLDAYGAQLEAEGQALLSRVTQSAAQMQLLLDDLLEYSQIAQKELKLEPMSLHTAVQGALALLEADIHALAADIRVEEPLPQVIGHPATVTLLIQNLLSNALKFISPGVPPQIRLWTQAKTRTPSWRGDRNPPSPCGSSNPVPAPEADSAAPLALGDQSLFIRLHVEDNGIGIPPADLGKIFEVFQRLHGKGAYPGTGLGLAMVRKGAERMGGGVGVESQPGKGSRFWVELPAAGNPAPPPTP